MSYTKYNLYNDLMSKGSPYMQRQLKQFKKNPQSFVDHSKKLINICTLKHNQQFIRKYKDYLNWEIISAKQTLSEEFIDEMKEYVVWQRIFSNQKLSVSFLRQHIDKLNENSWHNISGFQKLDEQFIKDYKNKLNWHLIITNQHHIPTSFFNDKEIRNCFTLQSLTNRSLTEEFIREHANEMNKICWDNITIFSKLSEKFMNEFADKLNWEHVAIYQKFGIRFAKKHEDKIDWEDIGTINQLSQKFIATFKDKLHWPTLMLTQIWTDDKLRKYTEYFKIQYFLANTKTKKYVTESCLREFFMEMAPTNFLNMNMHFTKDFILEIWDGK